MSAMTILDDLASPFAPQAHDDYEARRRREADIRDLRRASLAYQGIAAQWPLSAWEREDWAWVEARLAALAAAEIEAR